MKVLNRFTGNVIIEGKYTSLVDLLTANVGADLQGADLQGADLQNANLQGADLQGAYLSEANLGSANLRRADLYGANLQVANLRNATLWEADLSEANLPNYFICPEKGSFIGWKKIDNKILELYIPSKAKRTSSLVGRKCRAEYVKIKEIYNMDGTKLKTGRVIGGYRKDTYIKGELFYPDMYNDDIRTECANGIHFFITRKEAEEY